MLVAGDMALYPSGDKMIVVQCGLGNSLIKKDVEDGNPKLIQWVLSMNAPRSIKRWVWIQKFLK